MILLNKENFENYEWDYILFLHEQFANNKNINLLLKGHYLGLSVWDLSQFDITNNIELAISDIAKLIINIPSEQYIILYNKKIVAKGLLTIENLDQSALLLYEKYRNCDKIDENHHFINSVYDSCLKHIYG